MTDQLAPFQRSPSVLTGDSSIAVVNVTAAAARVYLPIPDVGSSSLAHRFLGTPCAAP